MASPSSSSSCSSLKARQAIRSISLPTRSHPSTLQAEEELTNLKSWEASVSSCLPDAETFYRGLTSLERLYTCVDDLLCFPHIQQALSQHEKLVDELLDRSMRLLDICGCVRDVVSQVKQHVREEQSALRRRKEGFTIDACLLKKLKKNARRAIADLKQIDHVYGSKLLNLEPHFGSVIRVLRDDSEESVSVFGLLLSFLSPKPKLRSKWWIVPKFVQKDEAQIRVEGLDCEIEGMEIGLECMFRRLIRTRASLLNVPSH